MTAINDKEFHAAALKALSAEEYLKVLKAIEEAEQKNRELFPEYYKFADSRKKAMTKAVMEMGFNTIEEYTLAVRKAELDLLARQVSEKFDVTLLTIPDGLTSETMDVLHQCLHRMWRSPDRGWALHHLDRFLLRSGIVSTE